MMRRMLSVAAIVALSLCDMAPRAAAACGGDCDGDGGVAINELVRAVSIALGAAPVGQCVAADGNGDGTITIAELIAAVNSALGGCDGGSATPTATPIPGATPSPTGVVLPGCDNGSFDVTYSNATAGNFHTSDLTLDLVTAGQVHDPRSGRYLWGIVGLQCIDNQPILHRGVQFQHLLATGPVLPGTYTLTPPFGTFIYQESDDGNASSIRAWDTASVTLTVESLNGDDLAFRITASMKPQPLLSAQTPMGTFDLEVDGTVERFTSQ